MKYEQQELIDRICDRFESDFQLDPEIEIASYLNNLQPHLQSDLLQELIPLHLELIDPARADPEKYRRFGDQYVRLALLNLPQTDVPKEKDRFAKSKIIGQYKLLEIIGEGAQGIVWKAEQQYPIRRQVALKMIRPGFGDSKQIHARFEAELKAMGMMNHPGIAKPFDAGETEEKIPYFVMELVHGQTLTQYCESNGLDLQARVHLFQQVCDAIQHAHQKGIIHRDLKPSNILVAQHDGKPVPKIIDFGLAKALHGVPLSDLTLHTQFGQVMGTFLYMSPEQAESNALEIDTLTDVYSLGVIFYELLTGSTPIERKTLAGKAIHDCIKYVKEHEPDRPSVRLTTGIDPQSGSSVQRTASSRRVKGELDYIVMKAMEKERKDRYSTCKDLADDLQRYLDDQPILARKSHTPLYVLRKYYRRNRNWVHGIVLVTIAALVVLGLLFVQSKRNQADRMVDRLLSAKPGQLEPILDSLRSNQTWNRAALASRLNQSDQQSDLRRLRLAMAVIGDQEQQAVLVDSQHVPTADFADYSETLRTSKEQLKPRVIASFEASTDLEHKVRTLVQLLSWYPDQRLPAVLFEESERNTRTAIIHRYQQLGGDYRALSARLESIALNSASFSPPEIRLIVLLAGERVGDAPPSLVLKTMNSVRKIHRSHGSVAVVAACEWCLSTQDKTDHQPRKTGDDFETLNNGIRLISINEGTPYWYGYPPDGFMDSFRKKGYLPLSQKETSYKYQISDKEITVEQFFSAIEPNRLFAEIKTRMAERLENDRRERPSYPMSGVSWYQIAEFCNALSRQHDLIPCYEIIQPEPTTKNEEGELIRPLKLKSNYLALNGFRLPTAQEWECAARAGAKSLWHFGDDIQYLKSYDQVNWQSGEFTLKVGSLKPNGFGLFDVHGNVREWTTDNDNRGYSGPNGNIVNHKIMKGGAYSTIAINTISARDYDHRPVDDFPNLGFRIMRLLSEPPPQDN